VTAAYRFIGWHGTNWAAATNIINRGVRREFEHRRFTDPWRGFYLSRDLAVANGYAVPTLMAPQAARVAMLRVYAPATIAVNLRLEGPLDQERATSIVGKEMFRNLDPHRNTYAITGSENSEDTTRTETIISWDAAERCVAIPSRIIPKGDGNGFTRKISAREWMISRVVTRSAESPF
jgi:hypothetical protein